MDEQEKRLKRECNIQGGALLIYKVIMNVAVFVVMFASAMVMAILGIMGGMFEAFTNEGMLPEDASVPMEEMISEAMMKSMGWGYLLAIAIGLLILLLWKKPKFFKTVLWQRGKPMRLGSFVFLLCLCIASQFVIQILASGAELIYNRFGFSLLGVLESAGVATDDFVMLLYACIAAPIAEEILFRGLVLRGLQPYGKGIAIWVSAILFGFFHGSPVQTPFALLIGLVLGYVAVEYNIVWAIVLHMFNNLVLGDVLPRLLSLLPYELPNVAMILILLLGTAAAAVIAWVRRREIPGVMQVFHSEDRQWKAVISAPCMIILVAMSFIDMATMMLLMVFFGA